MSVEIVWDRLALTDRENIFLYLNQEAGAAVAIAVDDRIFSLIEILRDNPMAGVRAGRNENQRKLVVPHFPFIVVYSAAEHRVSVLRILHTSRKMTELYRNREGTLGQ